MIVLAALFGLVGPSGASAGRFDTTVTISVEGRDFSGLVKSPRPRKCAAGRKVLLMKQVGAEQSPSSDPVVASDTASRNGDVYEWSTGNTGNTGRFYARVRRTAECKGDTSRTLRTQ